jgi:hypothetical protein
VLTLRTINVGYLQLNAFLLDQGEKILWGKDAVLVFLKSDVGRTEKYGGYK